jgi:glycine betaine/proline transport system substrate-binding protein
MVLKGILDQQQDIEVELYKIPEVALFEALATGEIDVAISAWLPYTHVKYQDMYHREIKKHSLLCDSLGLYMIVPEYAEMTSIEDLALAGSMLRNTIVIPESQNALFHFGKDIIVDYGLSNFTLVESNWDNIVTYIDESIQKKAAFAIIGVRPHWIFERYDIKTLSDPRRSLGNWEQAFVCINSDFLVRMPVICSFLANVNFTLSDIETLMEMNQTLGTEPYENAMRWINQNTSRINRWVLNVN